MSAAADRRIRRTPPVAERASGPGEHAPGTPPPTEGTKGVMPMARRFGPGILINGVAPLRHLLCLAPPVPGCRLTSTPGHEYSAAAGSAAGHRAVAAHRFPAGFVLFTISPAVALVLLGGDPRLYLIRESFITAGIGLAFIVSNPLPRPLGFFFARYFMSGNDQARLTWVNDRWQSSGQFPARHPVEQRHLGPGLGPRGRSADVSRLHLEHRAISYRVADRVLRFYAVLLGWSIMFGRRKRQEAMLDQAAHGAPSSFLKPTQHPEAVR
jgi:hypothetical protein